MLLFWILTFSILTGQLVKLPIGTHGGVSLLDIAVIFFCIVGLLRLKFKLRKPSVFILSAIFFIIIALFSLVATPLHLSSIEYVTSLSYTIRFSLYVLLGWIIYSGTFPILRKNIPYILIISGLGLAFIGLLQFIFLPDLGFLTVWGWDPHYFRTASTFLDPNFLGAYFVLTLILLVTRLQGILNRHLGIFMILVYLALLTTFSRGAYLAFLISFLTCSFLNKSFRWGIITFLLFSGLMIGFFSYQRLVAIPRNIDRTQSAEFRLGTWQQGWQIFSSHPILGVGFNAYKFALREYNFADKQFLKSHGSSTNDSSLLYVAATTGMIGLISFIFLLFSLVWIAFRHVTGDGVILLAGLVGLTTQSFFANTLFYPPLLLWTILIATKEDKS